MAARLKDSPIFLKVWCLFFIGVWCLASPAETDGAAKASPKPEAASSPRKKAKPGKTRAANDPPAVALTPEARKISPTSEPQKKDTVTASEKVGTTDDRPRREDPRFYKYKLNAALGTQILSSVGAGLLVGVQGGMAPLVGRPFYIGPEIDFSLFPSGSLIGTYVSAWYEKRIQAAPRLSVAIGALVGPAFASAMGGVGSMALAAFVDACIVQEVGEYASVRGQVRPGILGGYFTLIMDLNVSFRFL